MFKYDICFLVSIQDIAMCAVYGPALKYSGNYSNMDSSNIHTQHHEQQQQISGLLRYRSAPSSLLTNPVGIEGGFRSYVPSLGEEMEGMLDSGSNSGWSNVKNEEGGGGPVFCNEADEHIYDSHEGIQEFAPSESCSNVMMNNTIMDFQNSSYCKQWLNQVTLKVPYMVLPGNQSVCPI